MPSLTKNSRISIQILPCQFLTETLLFFDIYTQSLHILKLLKHTEMKREKERYLADDDVIGVRFGNFIGSRVGVTAAVRLILLFLSLPSPGHFASIRCYKNCSEIWIGKVSKRIAEKVAYIDLRISVAGSSSLLKSVGILSP